jgi:hypothetical protein
MTYNLELLRADVEDEMSKLARLSESFGRIEPMLELTVAEVGDYDRAAIGYYLHNF